MSASCLSLPAGNKHARTQSSYPGRIMTPTSQVRLAHAPHSHTPCTMHHAAHVPCCFSAGRERRPKTFIHHAYTHTHMRAPRSHAPRTMLHILPVGLPQAVGRRPNPRMHHSCTRRAHPHAPCTPARRTMLHIRPCALHASSVVPAQAMS